MIPDMVKFFDEMEKKLECNLDAGVQASREVCSVEP